MAKSKIIIELTSSDKDINSILKRVYIILDELDNDLSSWARKELYGYSSEESVPDYRKVKYALYGDYQVVGRGRITRYTKTILPTVGFDAKHLKMLTDGWLIQPIGTILSMLEASKKGEEVAVPLPVSMYSLFSEGTNAEVTKAYRYLSQLELENVVNKFEIKVLDLLLYLEKKFGNLDEFDIENFNISEQQLDEIKGNCKLIIYEGCNTNNFNIDKIKSKNTLLGDKSKVETKKVKNKNSNTGSGNNKVEKHTNIESAVSVGGKDKKVCWLKRLFGGRKNAK